MYEPLFQDLNASMKRVQDALTTIGDPNNGSIDWTTGQSTIKNGAAILKGLATATGDDPAANFLSLLQDGFAVPVGSPPLNDPKFRVIPWQSLYDLHSVQSMTQDSWDWIGISDVADLPQLATTIKTRFAYSPAYAVDAPHLQYITDSAQIYLPALKAAAAKPVAPVAHIFCWSRLHANSVADSNSWRRTGACPGTWPRTASSSRTSSTKAARH